MGKLLSIRMRRGAKDAADWAILILSRTLAGRKPVLGKKPRP
jgi:hypothetical protein